MIIKREWCQGVVFMLVGLTGFLVPVNGEGAMSLQAAGGEVYRQGESVDFNVHGVLDQGCHELVFEVRRAGVYQDHGLVYAKKLVLPADGKPVSERVGYCCDTEGYFQALLASSDGWESRPLEFTVIDTTPAAPVKREDEGRLRLRLVDKIDCAATNDPHFYRGDNQCRIVESVCGRYRESGPGNFQDMAPDGSGYRTIHDGWFGYRYGVWSLRQPHLIEIDYPHDCYRIFDIVLGEPVQLIYLTGRLIRAGYPITGETVTERFLLWPRTLSPDIHFLNGCPGSRAAASAVRIYAVDGGLPAMGAPKQGFSNREIGLHVDEGHIDSAFGGIVNSAEFLPPRGSSVFRVSNRQSLFEAARYYCEYARFMGMNFLTTGHPGYASLEESRKHLKIQLRVFEKYGVGCAVWLDQFVYPGTPMDQELAGQEPPPHFQVSRDGWHNSVVNKTNTSYKMGYPGHDPLHPAREAEVKEKIMDFVKEFKTFPALKGIQIRGSSRYAYAPSEYLMYRSINWGYSDYDVALFEKDTGTKVPVAVDDPEKYKKRYEWLMANKKEEWISWRCRKIEELIQRVIGYMRTIRPDLKLYLHVPTNFDPAYNSWVKMDYERVIAWPGELKRLFRERGLDLDRLARVPGLVVVPYEDIPAEKEKPTASNAMVLYGKLEYFADKEGAVRAEKDFSKNSGMNSMRQLYPEKEGYALPAIVSGDSTSPGSGFMQSLVRKMADNNVTFLASGNDNLLLPRLDRDFKFRDFIRRYRSLPDVDFVRYQGDVSLEPVALWSGDSGDHTYFYLANPADYPAAVSMEWAATTGVLEDASDNRTLAEAGGGKARSQLAVAGPGFEVFRHPRGWKLGKAERILAPERTRLAEKCVADAGVILKAARDELGGGKTLAEAEEFLRLAGERLKKGDVRSAVELCGKYLCREVYGDYGYPEGIVNPERRDWLDARNMVEATAPKATAGLEPLSKVLNRKDAAGKALISRADQLELCLDRELAERAALEVRYVSGGDFGPFKVLLNEKVAGSFGAGIGDSAPLVRTESVLGAAFLRGGKNTLTFMREKEGRLGLVGVGIRTVYVQIRDWRVIGMFANPGQFPGEMFSKDEELPPEKEVNFGRKYPGWKGSEVAWRTMRTEEPLIDMGGFFGVKSPELTKGTAHIGYPQVLGYAFTYVHGPEKVKVKFKVDKLDWFLKVFVNRKLVYTQTSGFHQGFFTAELNQGWNELLVKTVTGGASWTFNLSASFPEGVICSTEKKLPAKVESLKTNASGAGGP